MMETITPLIFGEDLVFFHFVCLQPHLHQKPSDFTMKTFFLEGASPQTCFGTKNALLLRQRPFFLHPSSDATILSNATVAAASAFFY